MCLVSMESSFGAHVIWKGSDQPVHLFSPIRAFAVHNPKLHVSNKSNLTKKPFYITKA